MVKYKPISPDEPAKSLRRGPARATRLSTPNYLTDGYPHSQRRSKNTRSKTATPRIALDAIDPSVPLSHLLLIADDMIMSAVAAAVGDDHPVEVEDTCLGSAERRDKLREILESATGGPAEAEAFAIDIEKLEEVRYHEEMAERFGIQRSGAEYNAYLDIAAKCWKVMGRSQSAYVGVNSALRPDRAQLALFAGRDWVRGDSVLGATGFVVMGEGDEEEGGVNLRFGVQIESGSRGRSKVSQVGTLTGPLRNANSSCEPNCRLVKSQGCALGCGVSLKALKAIQKGEELSFNYGEQYFAGQNLVCACPPCAQKPSSHSPPSGPTEPAAETPSSRRPTLGPRMSLFDTDDISPVPLDETVALLTRPTQQYVTTRQPAGSRFLWKMAIRTPPRRVSGSASPPRSPTARQLVLGTNPEADRMVTLRTPKRESVLSSHSLAAQTMAVLTEEDSESQNTGQVESSQEKDVMSAQVEIAVTDQGDGLAVRHKAEQLDLTPSPAISTPIQPRLFPLHQAMLELSLNYASPASSLAATPDSTRNANPSPPCFPYDSTISPACLTAGLSARVESL